jgi:dTDP-4-dehydrorhamnose reductase
MTETNRKIVITGAKGQLGGELCRILGERAVGLDIDTLDLTDRQAVLDRMLGIRPELIINCAAYTQVDKAETEQDLARVVNVGAVENLVEACRRLDCPLVQISTDYVFERGPRTSEDSASASPPRTPHAPREEVALDNEITPRPWSENDTPEPPHGIYARTKLEGEFAAAKWQKHIIVRTCGLYARRTDEYAKHFVKTILRLADTRPELRVVNDQHCTPTYVPHLAQAIIFLGNAAVSGEAPKKGTGAFCAQHPEGRSGKMHLSPFSEPAVPWGTYHVTNRGQTTWFDFAAEIIRLAGKTTPIIPITTAEFAAPAPRPVYSVLDTAKYHALGGPEMPDWQSGLRAFFTEK